MERQDEKRLLDGLIARMAEQFPTLPREHVERVVRAEHDALRDKPLRTYIPLLVEHEARRRLKTETRALSLKQHRL